MNTIKNQIMDYSECGLFQTEDLVRQYARNLNNIIEKFSFKKQSRYFYKIPMENRQWKKDKMEARIINGRPVHFSIPWMVKVDFFLFWKSTKLVKPKCKWHSLIVEEKIAMKNTLQMHQSSICKAFLHSR